jgi:integrase
LHTQFASSEWMIQSGAGTPVNPGNALKRYVRPAAQQLGITFGGWHDFRHSLSTNLRRVGVHPKVVSDILGHSKVNLAMDVYDRRDIQDIEKA